MTVWLDSRTLMDRMTEKDLDYIRAVCKAGMKAALRESNMKAYFTFSIKEHAYREIRWHRESYGWRTGQFRDLPSFAVRVPYPSNTDTCVELEPYHLLRYPGLNYD